VRAFLFARQSRQLVGERVRLTNRLRAAELAILEVVTGQETCLDTQLF
jgi:hypothetical protein